MSRLELAPSHFRLLANRAVDVCTRLLESLETMPSYPRTSGETATAILDRPLPEKGMGAAALDGLSDVISQCRPPSPRFYGYVLGSGEPVAAIGDLVASVLNQNNTAWRSSPGGITIERTVVRWLAEAIGCANFTGSLTGGGSSANLMALTIARETKLPSNEDGVTPNGTMYASAEVHMSIGKAAALLGLGYKAVRSVPVDDRFRMIPEELDRLIVADVLNGKQPVAVVATAGTVNTGSIDPLAEIAAIAHKHGAWFHVDGAYGALASIAVPEKFVGLNLADSLSLDPHKWLYQPVDCGCLLYREPGLAQKAFSHSGDYTKTLSNDPVEGFAFFEESMELSRRFRALKLWLSLRYHGMAAFRESIQGDLDLAQELAGLISAEPALEVLAPVELSAVCFRFRGGKNSPFTDAKLNAMNAAILRNIIQRGNVYISNATIHGRFALRACIVNHRANSSHMQMVVSETLAAAAEVVL